MCDYFIITHQQYYLELWLVLYERLALFSGCSKVHCNKIKCTIYIVLWASSPVITDYKKHVVSHLLMNAYLVQCLRGEKLLERYKCLGHYS